MAGDPWAQFADAPQQPVAPVAPQADPFAQFQDAPGAGSPPPLTIRPSHGVTVSWDDDQQTPEQKALNIKPGLFPWLPDDATSDEDLRNQESAMLGGAAGAIPFGDRAAAGLRSLIYGRSYDDNLADIRAEQAARQQKDPGMFLAGSVAGGAMLPIGAVGRVAQGATTLARVGRGAVAGGLMGAVQGTSASPDLANPGQTATSAALGTGLGAAAGGALPMLASGVGKAARLLRGDAVPAVPGMGSAARDTFLDAIDKDGAANVLRNQDLYGDPAMLFDYGTGLRGIAEGLATKDGPAASTITDALGYRQAATNARVRQGLVANFGPAQDPQMFGGGLDQERSQIAGRLPSIFAKAPPVDISDALARIDQRLPQAGEGETDALLKARSLLTRGAPPSPPQSFDGSLPDPTQGLGPSRPGPAVTSSTGASGGGFALPPRPTGPQPPSLLTFLQRNGGVQDPGGDLRAMGMDLYPGLIRQNGMPLDVARRAAAEAGYLGGNIDDAMANTTPNDLLDALGNHPTYSVRDADAVAARQAYDRSRSFAPAPTALQTATQAVKDHLVDSGIPEALIDPKTLDAAGYLAARGQVPVEQAWEAAVMAPHFPGDTPLPRAPQPSRVPLTDAAQLHTARKDLDSYVDWQDRNPLSPPSSAVMDSQGAYQGMRGAVSDALKAQVPGYADAMGGLHNTFRRGDAFNFGRQSLAAGDNPVWPQSFGQRHVGFGEDAGAQDAVRLGQRSIMEEAVGTKPNDQLAIKGIFQTGNTPGYTAPGVTPGSPDLTGWNAQKLAASFGHEPVARMQELLNANDAFNQTFTKVAQNSATARRIAMMQALKDAEWQPRDIIPGRVADVSALGAGLEVGKKVLNTVGHLLQAPVSNAARDADLARVGTLIGPDRAKITADLLRALPARQANNILDQRAQTATLYGGAIAAGALNPAVLAAALRNYSAPDQR